jgi:hypothetical protein
MSFGADNVNVFQAMHNGMLPTKSNISLPPHLEAIHCMAHCTNLVVQILFQIPIVKCI